MSRPRSLLTLPSPSFLLWIVLLLGVVLRFYQLDWGSPYFFHPDERNIGSSISQLHFPNQLNPHFFAYGGLPIYITFLLGLITKWFSVFNGSSFPQTLTFEQAILLLRIVSATLSVITIYLCYQIGTSLKNTMVGLITAALVTFSPGLIQSAHFGTFESWLTFLSVLLFWVVLKSWGKITIKKVLLLGIIFGTLLATKISSLFFVPLAIFPLLDRRQLSFFKRVGFITLVGLMVCFIWLLTNPFSILDFSSFSGSITYESQVAVGELLVFYTGEFLGIVRGLYPLLHIYPFLLNPLMLLLAIPAVIMITVLGVKYKKYSYLALCLFLLMMVVTQVPLFVQWTRYYVPTLPFIYFILALFFWEISLKLKKKFSWTLLPFGVVISIVTLIYCFAFVKTVYLEKDTREEAALFASKTISPDARLLSETYDLGIIPFDSYFPHITLFNFYDLDTYSFEYNQATLQETLHSIDYLILPSQRLLKVRLSNPQSFPQGYMFYKELTTNSRKFTKIYQTPCDMWCSITYGFNILYAYEGTTNIFDHPAVFIYKINHE